MRDFKRYPIREIIARYMVPEPDGDLDAMGLFLDTRSWPLKPDDGFYLLPIDWEYDGEDDVGAFIEQHGLRYSFQGSQLVDVISVARDQRPDASAEEVLEAYNHYLEYDAFLEWS